MDAKSLQEAGRNILKASDGGDPPSTLVSLLQALPKSPMSEDLLRQSKIGVAVNKLRQNKDSKVASLAGTLINKWKQDVSAAKKAAGKMGSPAPGAAAAARAVNGATSGARSSPAPGAGKVDGVKAESGAAKRKSKVAPEKRTSRLDEVNTKVTGHAVRDGCVELIYNGLAFMSPESPDDVLPIALSVELAAYESHGNDTTAAYKTKMRSLFQNLKMKGNETLRRDVYSGVISPKKFVTMTSDELKSEEKRAQDAALEKENMNKAMTAVEVKAIVTTMPCGKCGGRETSVVQAQTRSADEPLTNFCNCQICGNSWKFS